jgi:hypothetical protein
MGIEIIATWFFKDLRSRARTDLEGLGTLRNPYCRLDAALLPQNISHNFAICFAYCSWYSLRIDVHRCSDVRMTQKRLLNLNVHFVLPQQRGVRVPKRMPTNAPNARRNSCGHYVILTNLARPERISRGWIHKHPWRIVVLRSLSMFLQPLCPLLGAPHISSLWEF